MVKRVFHKTMTVNELETYFHEKKHGFLVAQAFNKKCYGFNLTRADECANVMQIILDKNNFFVSGWKFARNYQTGSIITMNGMNSSMRSAVMTVHVRMRTTMTITLTTTRTTMAKKMMMRITAMMMMMQYA